MSKIREMLLARRKEIKSEMAPLEKELAEIDAALAVISQPELPLSDHSLKSDKILHTAREQIHAILSLFPSGLKSSEVKACLREHYGREMKSHNVSWYLSRLKADGKLELFGERWKLKNE